MKGGASHRPQHLTRSDGEKPNRIAVEHRKEEQSVHSPEYVTFMRTLQRQRQLGVKV